MRSIAERGEWLKALTKRRWSELDAEAIASWRRTAIESLLEIRQDTIVVSHFMVINAVVSWANEPAPSRSAIPEGSQRGPTWLSPSCPDRPR